jgi:hypothetical protein
MRALDWAITGAAVAAVPRTIDHGVKPLNRPAFPSRPPGAAVLPYL